MMSLRARDVVAMYSYADAKRRYEEIKPARDGYRYLSRNRSLWMEQHGEEYVCTYHHNKVVTYRPDNTIMLRSCGWDTQSTATFVSACTGLSVYLTRGTLYVCIQGGYYPMDGATIDMNSRTITNPTPQQRKVLDKAKAKEMRAPLMPFIRDITNLAKAMDYINITAFRDVLPEDVRMSDMHTRRAISHAMLAGEKELVTNWILFAAAIEAAITDRTPAEAVKAIVSKILHQLYVDNDCVVLEDVPLGEIPKPSRY